MTRHLVLLASMLGVALLAGCGDDGQPAAAAAADAAMHRDDGGAMHVDAPSRGRTARTAARGVEVKAVRSQYGRIVADGRGQAFYFFDRETSAQPRCYGACAKAWPPFTTKGRPRGGRGARALWRGPHGRPHDRRVRGGRAPPWVSAPARG